MDDYRQPRNTSIEAGIPRPGTPGSYSGDRQDYAPSGVHTPRSMLARPQSASLVPEPSAISPTHPSRRDLQLVDKSGMFSHNGNSAPGTPRRDAFGLHLTSSPEVMAPTSPQRRPATSTKNRLHVQSILASRSPEALAEELFAAQQAITAANAREKKLVSENSRLESELRKSLKEAEADKSSFMPIATRRSQPANMFNKDPALINNLKESNRQLRAARDELSSELVKLQRSTRATKVEELEAEACMYLEEMDRQKKLAAALEERLHDSQAALSAAQAMVAEKESMSKKLKEAAKLYGTDGHLADPSKSTEKDASRSLRQELQMATIQAGRGLAGDSKELRATLASMQSAHRLLVAEAAALRHFLPEGCAWGDLDPQRWKKAGVNPRGASAILRFLRTHEMRLHGELVDLPGAKHKNKDVSPPKELEGPAYHVVGEEDPDSFLQSKPAKQKIKKPRSDTEDPAAEAWRIEAQRLRHEMDNHMETMAKIVDSKGSATPEDEHKGHEPWNMAESLDSSRRQELKPSSVDRNVDEANGSPPDEIEVGDNSAAVDVAATVPKPIKVRESDSDRTSHAVESLQAEVEPPISMPDAGLSAGEYSEECDEPSELSNEEEEALEEDDPEQEDEVDGSSQGDVSDKGGDSSELEDFEVAARQGLDGSLQSPRESASQNDDAAEEAVTDTLAADILMRAQGDSTAPDLVARVASGSSVGLGSQLSAQHTGTDAADLSNTSQKNIEAYFVDSAQAEESSKTLPSSSHHTVDKTPSAPSTRKSSRAGSEKSGSRFSQALRSLTASLQGSRRTSQAGSEASEQASRRSSKLQQEASDTQLWQSSRRTSQAGSESSEAVLSHLSRQSSKEQEAHEVMLSQASRRTSQAGSEASHTTLSQVSRHSSKLQQEAPDIQQSQASQQSSRRPSQAGEASDSALSQSSRKLQQEASDTQLSHGSRRPSQAGSDASETRLSPASRQSSKLLQEASEAMLSQVSQQSSKLLQEASDTQLSQASRRASQAGSEASESRQSRASQQSSKLQQEASEAMLSQVSRHSSKLEQEASATRLSHGSRRTSQAGSEASEAGLSQASRQSSKLQQEASEAMLSQVSRHSSKLEQEAYATRLSQGSLRTSQASSEASEAKLSQVSRQSSKLLQEEVSEAMLPQGSHHRIEASIARSESQTSKVSDHSATLSQDGSPRMSNVNAPPSLLRIGPDPVGQSSMPPSEVSHSHSSRSASPGSSLSGSRPSASTHSRHIGQSNDMQLMGDQETPQEGLTDGNIEETTPGSGEHETGGGQEKDYAGFANDGGSGDEGHSSVDDEDDEFPPDSPEFSDSDEELLPSEGEDLEEDVF